MINEKKEDRYEYQSVEFDLDEYVKKVKIKSNFPQNGIIILPHYKWGRFSCSSFMPESFNFVKWVKQKGGIEKNISILDVKVKTGSFKNASQECHGNRW